MVEREEKRWNGGQKKRDARDSRVLSLENGVGGHHVSDNRPDQGRRRKGNHAQYGAVVALK